MRGSDQQSGDLFSYVDIEARVPARHPLRAIRAIVNEGLAGLDGEFDKLYADTGRDSIPPERLLRAALLQAFFSIRSERLLMEQLDYNRKHPVRTAGSVGQAARAAAVVRQFQGSRSTMRLAG